MAKEVIHWCEGHREEHPSQRIYHSHKDPTADAAIRNVMREERRKKKRRRERPRIGVWRAEEAQPDAGK